MADDLRSLNHEFYGTAERFGNRVAFTRRDADTDEPTTFAAAARRAECFAAGLRDLGLRPRGRVALIADNNLRWFVADRGTLLARGVDVPQPRDVAPSALQHVLCHSGATIAIVEGSDNRARIHGWAREGRLPRLTHVVRFEDAEPTPDPALPEHAFPDVEARGASTRERVREHAESARAQNLATIVYTSGTTGAPKGVVLTHANILHNIRVIPKHLELHPGDHYLSILPAWHMFERTLEYTLLHCGAHVTYTSRRRFRRDLAEIGPTVAAFVPRILEMIHADLTKKVDSAQGFRGLLARTAIAVARRRHAARLTARGLGDRTGIVARAGAMLTVGALAAPHALFDRLVHRKIRDALGPTLRMTVSGGGALAPHVDALLNAIGYTVVVGYGLTETAPVVSVRTPTRNPVGTIGLPLPETEIAIRRDDTGDGPGRIAIRGPQVMRGYFRDRSLTASVVDANGWFDSGDLGTQRADGELRITGRAKDTIVLRSGENVEPQPIETSLLQSPWIEQVVVVGQDHKELGALVVVDREALPPDTTDVTGLVEADVRRRSGPAAGFRAFETVRRVHVLDAPFTVEDGSLTHTLKLRRNVIAERHAAAIAALATR